MEKLLWAIALDMALVVAAIGVTMNSSSSDTTSSVVEACVAGEQDYQNLYVLSFVAAAVAILQSLAALLVPVVVGATKKIEEVPHESSRITMFTATLSHTQPLPFVLYGRGTLSSASGWPSFDALEDGSGPSSLLVIS
ncbi:hypothetical protein PR202_ga24298 [Eleusine coracana subsp. coracana]|uniref:CASP-like protein n=1 Tax=Eleusine coracana subsp. coracana TaxID=191504 RepID=A0AAV5D804_ELECO|nr:hypothetical protein PR202_ga24298 [Eleusine coracana subsp. coracana]